MAIIEIFHETITLEADEFWYNFSASFPLFAGDKYTVTCDGVRYECVAKESPDWGLYLGNLIHTQGEIEDTGENFCYLHYGGAGTFAFADTGGSHTVSITTKNKVVLPETAFNFLGISLGLSVFESPTYAPLAVGQTYAVTVNGTKFVLVCIDLEGMPILLDGELGEWTFYIQSDDGETKVFLKSGEDTLTVGIEYYVEDEPNDGGGISFIKFLTSSHFPYLPKNLFGWKLAQKNGGE